MTPAKQNKPQQPGPGRSTSKAAFDELTRAVAERNDKAHKAARKLREKQDVKVLAEKRKRDLG